MRVSDPQDFSVPSFELREWTRVGRAAVGPTPFSRSSSISEPGVESHGRNKFCKNRFGSEGPSAAVDWFTICFASDSATMGLLLRNPFWRPLPKTSRTLQFADSDALEELMMHFELDTGQIPGALRLVGMGA